MKNTKNILKKILMILCTFALFVPMAFGLVACDDTSSGNNGGKLNTGNELTNDRSLFWGSVISGIDYLNTQSGYDAKNIAVSLMSATNKDLSAKKDLKIENVTEGDYKYKQEIAISYPDNSNEQTSSVVYTLYYKANTKTGDTSTSPVSSQLNSYEKSTTYLFEGQITVGEAVYNFNATREVGEDGKVKETSTITITKQGDDSKTFNVKGTYAKGLTFTDIESNTLATITIGETKNEIAKVVIGSNEYKNVSVANSKLDTTNKKLTYTFLYKTNNSDQTIANCTLKVYPSVTASGDAS